MQAFRDGLDSPGSHPDPNRWFSQALQGQLGVADLESTLSRLAQASCAVALSSTTAALHAALCAAGVEAGDEVIVPTMAFVGTANAVVHQGAVPVFCDVDPGTLLMDPIRLRELISGRSRAVIAVDYAGQPCDYEGLRHICSAKRVPLIGQTWQPFGPPGSRNTVADLVDLAVVGFDDDVASLPGQWGGAVITARQEWADRVRRFRWHGLDDHAGAHRHGCDWASEMVELGYDYGLSDLQSAGALYRLEQFDCRLERRRTLVREYLDGLRALPMFRPLEIRDDTLHAHGLFVVEVEGTGRLCRRYVLDQLRQHDVPAEIHYRPMHLHPYYRRRFGTSAGQCPIAERAYGRILSLPLSASMTVEDVRHVVTVLQQIVQEALGSAA